MRSEIGHSIDIVDLARITHVVSMWTLGEVVTQVGHGYVGPILREQSGNAVLASAVVLRAGQADHVQLGRSLAKRVGPVRHDPHTLAIPAPKVALLVTISLVHVARFG